MKILIKSLFYSFLLAVLFILCLYHVPSFSEFIDITTESNISEDIKMKVDHLLEGTWMVDNVIDNFWTNTKRGISERLEILENSN